MLQTKYSAMESKSKELAMQQNASVSGATAALSGLHARLDNLVEQLVFSYNISEQDLEVGISIYRYLFLLSMARMCLSSLKIESFLCRPLHFVHMSHKVMHFLIVHD